MNDNSLYRIGLEDGFIDGIVISQPINTGGHSFNEYCRVEIKYKTAIYNFFPTEYERGYGNGFDCAAIYLKIGEET